MADEPIINPVPAEPSRPEVPAGRRRARTAVKWTGIGLGALLLLAVAGFAWLNSQFGTVKLNVPPCGASGEA